MCNTHRWGGEEQAAGGEKAGRGACYRNAQKTCGEGEEMLVGV